MLNGGTQTGWATSSGIRTGIRELYKIGAAAGFLSGFLKFSFIPARPQQQGGTGEEKS